MKVYLNSITGIDDAIISMFMSKRTWTPELENDIRDNVNLVTDRYGRMINNDNLSLKLQSLRLAQEELRDYNDRVERLVKWGKSHITLLRFIDISITVEGLHRAGQDDWDAHAMRFNNRIIRTSTRMSDFSYEMSDFYEEKILPTDVALASEEIEIPDEITRNGLKFVKTVNGYIREDLKDDKDVKRGLYMMSIPSNFIFRINLCEWCHVYKERNINGGAHPEVKELCETIADKITEFQPMFDRELFLAVKN